MPQKIVVGLDLGGTHIKSCAFDQDGCPLTATLCKTDSLVDQPPETTVQQFLKAGEKAISGICSFDEVDAIGLCTPGPAKPDGEIEKSGNLKHPRWENFRVRDALAEASGKPVAYSNDGTAAALGEYSLRGSKPKVMAAFTLGTGLGGGLVIDGKAVIGRNGYAAEFGHIPIPGFELSCSCGRIGCAESEISLMGLHRKLQRTLFSPGNLFHPLHETSDEGISRALKLLGMAQRSKEAPHGDRLARDLFRDQATALGQLCFILSMAFDSELYVIGGGLTESQEDFKAEYMECLKSSFAKKAYIAQVRNTRFEWALDGDRAGSRGAAMMALDLLN